MPKQSFFFKNLIKKYFEILKNVGSIPPGQKMGQKYKLTPKNRVKKTEKLQTYKLQPCFGRFSVLIIFYAI
jgi:hypothetical protein